MAGDDQGKPRADKSSMTLFMTKAQRHFSCVGALVKVAKVMVSEVVKNSSLLQCLLLSFVFKVAGTSHPPAATPAQRAAHNVLLCRNDLPSHNLPSDHNVLSVAAGGRAAATSSLAC